MVYKLTPVFMDKIWGGDYFSLKLDYPTSSSCGEAWGISGIDGVSSVVSDGTQETTLAELYKNNKNLFGNHPSDEFPILVKLIDSNKDLSIQIHPGDDYAKKHHNSYGKTECWYVVDCKEDASIIVGHNAKTKEEVIQKIENKEYDSLLNKFDIKKGDMFDIYAGTVHAICNGTIILEVQQASDVTYRFYDYDRLENGKPRELHVEHALNVIDVPSKEIKHTGVTPYFSFLIQEINMENRVANQYGDYYFVIDGFGRVNDTEVQKGEFIFVPSNEKYTISGDLRVGFINIK